MQRKIFTFLALSVFALAACGGEDVADPTKIDETGLKQDEAGGWSKVVEPSKDEVYSEFEQFVREEGSKGTQDNPYKVKEKAEAKIGYWGVDLSRHEGMIEIEIDTIFTGDETNHPDFEVPENTQRVAAATNIKMVEGPEDVAYAISIQPFVYDYDEQQFIAQEPGLGNPFNSVQPMTLGDERVGTILMLVSEGDLDGNSFMLDTGVDQVWFEFNEE